MANPPGRIKVRLQIDPVETVEMIEAKKSSKWEDIEVESGLMFKHSGGKAVIGHTIQCDWETNRMYYKDVMPFSNVIAGHQGYNNGNVEYVGINNISSDSLGGTSNVSFMYLRHTGYEYLDSGNLSNITNNVDSVEVRLNSNTGNVFCVLSADQAVAMPLQSGYGWSNSDAIHSDEYFFRAVDPTDLSAGETNVALEYILITNDANV